jgi:hypothetical protein
MEACPVQELSGKRKFLYSVILILFVYLMAKLAGFAAYSLTKKEMFPWALLQAERHEVIHGDPDEKLRHSLEKRLKKEQKKRQEPRRMPTSEVLHPYLGFIFNKTRPDCSEYGFIDRRVLDNPTAPVSTKTDDNYIVLIIGGSFAYGTSISSTEGYIVKQLRNLPPLKNKKIIIHTVAIGGYKQPQQLIALNYFLSIGAHFDLVINIDGFNEIALPPFENVPKRVNPFFPRMWWMRAGTITDSDMLVRLAKIEMVKEKRKNTAKVFSSFPLRYSVAGNLFWRFSDIRTEGRIKKMEEEYTRYKTDERTKLRYVATGPAFHYENDAELYQDLARAWGRSSRLMYSVCRTNGIDYFHFLQPNQYVEGSKPMTEEERKAGWRDGHAYKTGVEKGYPYLIATGRELAEEGVPFHDLTMMFAENDAVLYRDTCCHLNETGYNLVVDRIVSVITEQYWQGKLLSLENR